MENAIENFRREYDRLYRWRELWIGLANRNNREDTTDAKRSLNAIFLASSQSREDRILRHINIANNKIGELMREIDEWREQTKNFGSKIYIASKTAHAEKWQNLREAGINVISTWIDEAGANQSASLADLADRCIREAAQSDYLILYCEPGEIMKGALIEIGAALGAGKKVFAVGSCVNITSVFQNHPLWVETSSINDALRHISKESIPNNI